MTDLENSIARLAEFRRAIEDDGVVDDDSGLTAADLDAVLAQLRRAADVALIEAEVADHLSGGQREPTATGH